MKAFDLLEPVISLVSAIALGLSLKIYHLVAQVAASPPIEWVGQGSVTAILAYTVHFVLSRMQASLDKNTAAIEQLLEAIKTEPKK